jgi:hypothetical protein
MSDENYQPTKAEFLAGLVTGSMSMESKMASVQRSHRFPLHIYIQIENLAQIGNVPVSVIINELLECGLEALSKELPPEVIQQSKMVREGLTDKTYANDVQIVKLNRKTKLRSVKPVTEK